MPRPEDQSPPSRRRDVTRRVTRREAAVPRTARGRRPARDRAGDAGPLARRPGLRAVAGADRGGPAVDVLRGAADGERHAGRAPRRGPGLQGRLPPVQDHAGLPRAAPGRLGLPRPAGRGRGRAGTRRVRQEGDRGLRDRRVQRAMPRVGAAARGRVRGAHRADGLLGRPAARLPHHGRRTTSSRSGGRSRSSSTRACWSGTTGSARTARAARPRCPITRWASRTCTGPCPTRR